MPGLSTFLAKHIQTYDLEWLFSGRLVVTYGETNNRWHFWYESRPGEPSFQLSLDTPTGSSMLVRDEVLAKFLNQLFAQGWYPTLLSVESTDTQQPRVSSDQEGQSDAPVVSEKFTPQEPSSG